MVPSDVFEFVKRESEAHSPMFIGDTHSARVNFLGYLGLAEGPSTNIVLRSCRKDFNFVGNKVKLYKIWGTYVGWMQTIQLKEEIFRHGDDGIRCYNFCILRGKVGNSTWHDYINWMARRHVGTKA